MKTIFVFFYLFFLFTLTQAQIIINDNPDRDSKKTFLPDTLIKKNGISLIGKIININATQIKFQTPDQSNQTYILLRNTIDTIKYGKVIPLSENKTNIELSGNSPANNDTIFLKNKTFTCGKITNTTPSGIKIKSTIFPYNTSKIHFSKIDSICYINGKILKIDETYISNFKKTNTFIQAHKTEFSLNIGLGNITYSNYSFKHWIPYEPFTGERFFKISPSGLEFKPGINYGAKLSFLLHKKYKIYGETEYLKSSGKYIYNIDIPIISGYNFYFLSLENYLKIKMHTFAFNIKKSFNINNYLNGYGGFGAGFTFTKIDEHMEGFFYEEIDFNNSQNANSFCGNLFSGLEFPLSKNLKSFIELQYLIIPELEYKMPGASVSGGNYYGFFYYLYISDHINVVNPSAFQIKTGIKF